MDDAAADQKAEASRLREDALPPPRDTPLADSLAPPRTLDDYKRVGAEMLAAGVPLVACDTLTVGLTLFPNDVRLRQLLALALAQRYNLDNRDQGAQDPSDPCGQPPRHEALPREAFRAAAVQSIQLERGVRFLRQVERLRRLVVGRQGVAGAQHRR